MRGAIPPLSNTPSWRGAQLKHRDNLNRNYWLGSSFEKQWMGWEDNMKKDIGEISYEDRKC
jgi:hypothetical protein